MGTTCVQVEFHSNKFVGNLVKHNWVLVVGSYLFYHLEVWDLLSHNSRQFKNGQNLWEPPQELGLEMRTWTAGSRSGQIKWITMELNGDVIDMNSHIAKNLTYWIWSKSSEKINTLIVLVGLQHPSVTTNMHSITKKKWELFLDIFCIAIHTLASLSATKYVTLLILFLL